MKQRYENNIESRIPIFSQYDYDMTQSRFSGLFFLLILVVRELRMQKTVSLLRSYFSNIIFD